MLADPALWRKWAGREHDRPSADAWADLPTEHALVEDARTAENPLALHAPTAGDGWPASDFRRRRLGRRAGGLRPVGMVNAAVHDRVDDRGHLPAPAAFDLPSLPTFDDVRLQMFHDEDAEVYLNGVLACKVGGYNVDYEPFELSAAARAALRPGLNVLAIHCHQTEGGQYIDAGLSVARP